MAEGAKKTKKKSSAEKRTKQSIKRRMRNIQAKSRVKTSFRKVQDAISSGKIEEIDRLSKEAISIIDKYVSKGIIHKNKAARKKSRLMKKVNAIAGAQ